MSRLGLPGRAALVRLAAAALAAACAGTPARDDAGVSDSASTASASAAGAADTAGGWTSLVEGTDVGARWRGYRTDSVPGGWTLAGGVLSKDAEVADIISRDEYGDFEFDFEWKLAPGGNAGVFYRATEEYDRVYWSGPEYQLLDDAGHADGKSRLTSAASAYGLYPAPAGVVKPAGEWNAGRIVARGPRIEHWLNGQKVVEYEVGSPDWSAKVKASKFREWANYGRAPRGRIAIQGDHTGRLELRNVRIREPR